MGLAELYAELEDRKAKCHAAKLRAVIAERKIEEMMASERGEAYRAIADAAFAVICENPSGATADDVLLRACQDCGESQQRLRTLVLRKAVAEHKNVSMAV